MNKIGKWVINVSLIGLFALLLLIGFYFFYQLDKDFSSISPTQRAIERKFSKEHAGWKNLRFDLVDPGDAPNQIRSLVERGYQIMLHTHVELPENAPHPINCTNCHIAGGITTGGMGGGISLAGVGAKYPKYNAARSRVEDLPMRVNDCFKYSMNGKPLALDSQDMLAIITYLQWISSNYPIYQSSPWLGLPALKSKHQLNADRGQQIYQTYCADCHGRNGEGNAPTEKYPNVLIPPLWGPESYKREAGLGKIENLASFIYHNMPYEEPHLPVEDALDVAAYILKQPRP